MTNVVEENNKPKKYNLEELAEIICALSLIDAAELVNLLGKKLGVDLNSVIAASSSSSGINSGEGAAHQAEEKTEFKIFVKECTDKIKTIKVVREIMGNLGVNLGLKEAKERVEKFPGELDADRTYKKEAAEEIKKKLEEVGAKIEFQ